MAKVDVKALKENVKRLKAEAKTKRTIANRALLDADRAEGQYNKFQQKLEAVTKA